MQTLRFDVPIFVIAFFRYFAVSLTKHIAKGCRTNDDNTISEENRKGQQPKFRHFDPRSRHTEAGGPHAHELSRAGNLPPRVQTLCRAARHKHG